MVTCPSPFKPMELKCVTDTVSAATVAWGNRPASAVRNKMALISTAFTDAAAAVNRGGHRRISPIGDVAAAIDGGLQTSLSAQRDVSAAVDCRIHMNCVYGADIDMPAALYGGTNRILSAEAALALDFAATGNGDTLDPRRHDFHFQIVMVGAVLVAGVDDELA